jgi:hypothetical protein
MQVDLFYHASNWFLVIASLFLLFFGRKLFWLFVAVFGFILGFYYGPLLWPAQSLIIIWGIALGAGILGAILAFVAKDAAILVSGFLAGVSLTHNMLILIHFPPSRLNWILLIICGILMAWLLFTIFDYVLIFLSSFFGAYTLARILNFLPRFALLIFFVLFFVGIVFQLKIFINEKKTNDEK